MTGSPRRERRTAGGGKVGGWDESRNTSRAGVVPPGSGLEVAALIRRQRDQEWYQWIANGRPDYTSEQYAALGTGIGKRRGRTTAA